MAGAQVGNFYEDLRRIPVVVRFDETIRNNTENLKKVPVEVRDNLVIPLQDLATIKTRSLMSPILRENMKRRTAVLINTRDRDIEGFVTEAQNRIAKKVTTPPGLRMEWFGSFKNLAEAKKRIFVLGSLALLLVTLMIFMAFKSLPETLIILASIPLALVGGVVGLILLRLPFSISAAVGFIALSGIAVLNGVVLVNNMNSLKNSSEPGSTDWIVEGARLRLRAVLMTALVDVFGFLPMVFSSGVGSEVQKPLAAVIIGGVLSSTLLTLIFIPIVVSIRENWGRSSMPTPRPF
jgi:cobalt-zinc-cadmium resistance protein CzcA